MSVARHHHRVSFAPAAEPLAAAAATGRPTPTNAANTSTSTATTPRAAPPRDANSLPSGSGEFSFASSPLDASLHAYYPGLLESMRLDGRVQRVRGKVLATQSWKKILTFVIESGKSGGGGVGGGHGLMGGGGVGGGTPFSKKGGSPSSVGSVTRDSTASSTAAPRGDPLRGEEVYGLGGGYNPLAKDRSGGVGGGARSVGGRTASSRFREPDTEAWHHWHADEWRAWKEWRAREKERLSKMPSRDPYQGAGVPTSLGPSALAAAGTKSSRPGAPVGSDLLMALASSSRSRDDLKSGLDLGLDLDALDHIHTVRHTHAPVASHHTGKQGRAIIAAHAKTRAIDRRAQREQKARAADLYRNIWTQQMKVLKSSKSLAHYSDVWDRKLQGYKMTLERDGQGNRIRALHLLDEREKRKVLLAQNGLIDESAAVETDEDVSGSESDPTSASDDDGEESAAGEGGPSIPAAIRKLQASNPHKHVYHGAMSARNFRAQASASMAELAANNGFAPGSLSARGPRDSTSLPASFESMFASGVSSVLPAPLANSSSKPRPPNLFARAVLALKNRKAVLAFDEREMTDLKEIFDGLARDGYSKITKASFKAIVASNFGAAGVGHAATPMSSTDRAKEPPPTPIYVDRARMDPLVDRIWLAVNSNGRNSNFLDFSDWVQMIGIALNGTVEDKAACQTRKQTRRRRARI